MHVPVKYLWQPLTRCFAVSTQTLRAFWRACVRTDFGEAMARTGLPCFSEFTINSFRWAWERALSLQCGCNKVASSFSVTGSQTAKIVIIKCLGSAYYSWPKSFVWLCVRAYTVVCVSMRECRCVYFADIIHFMLGLVSKDFDCSQKMCIICFVFFRLYIFF